jgi:hypothetical protein
MPLIEPAPAPKRTLSDPRIRHWLKGEPRQNFGDYLSELLALRMLRHPKVEADAYHLVGSVIDEQFIRRALLQAVGDVRRGTIAFWGCGVRSEHGLSPALRERALIFGVRGPISRDALGLPADTVLGDPALLLPLIHQPRPSAETAGRTICVPHMRDPRSDADLLKMSGADMVVRAVCDNDLDSLGELLDRIIAADFVLSASLHGAIVAAAFGRPFAFWNNGHLDVPLKWRDFSLSIGVEAEFHETVEAGRAAYAGFAPRLRRPPLAPLLEICPFSVRPSVLLRAHVADGRIAPADAAAAVAVLDEADAREDARQDRLLTRSIAYRLERERPGAALSLWTGRGRLAAKARLKRLLRR